MLDAAQLTEAVPSPPVDGGHPDREPGRLVDRLDPIDDFNFRHFRMRHMVAELLRPGLLPGSQAPDFELSSTDGERMRLSHLRGRPVLLHFVSYTCPVTRGGVHTMRELHRLYGERVRFVEVLVRQAHPGERHGAYGSYEEKLEDACAYVQEEGIAWPVLIDDLAGTVQRAYGGLAAAVYLIDSRGTRRLLRDMGPVTRTPARDRRTPGPRRRRHPGRRRASIAGRIWPLRSWRDRAAPLAAVRKR